MPKVYNKHKGDAPAGAVYIGRGSLFGNPFRLAVDGNRDQVIAMFQDHLDNNPELQAAVKSQLKGRDLVCFCAPLACHGDILLALANPPDDLEGTASAQSDTDAGDQSQKQLFL